MQGYKCLWRESSKVMRVVKFCAHGCQFTGSQFTDQTLHYWNVWKCHHKWIPAQADVKCWTSHWLFKQCSYLKFDPDNAEKSDCIWVIFILVLLTGTSHTRKIQHWNISKERMMVSQLLLLENIYACDN